MNDTTKLFLTDIFAYTEPKDKKKPGKTILISAVGLILIFSALLALCAVGILCRYCIYHLDLFLVKKKTQ